MRRRRLTGSAIACLALAIGCTSSTPDGTPGGIDALADEPRTMVFYEGPHRLVKTLAQFEAVFGPERPAAVGRELTKKFEEVQRGTLAELRTHYEAQAKVRGEVVIIVGGTG